MDIETLIRDQGFSLVRQKKHRVYQDSGGRTFVTSSTPSDWRAGRNILTELARITGKSKRRTKKGKKQTLAFAQHDQFATAQPEPAVAIIMTPAEPPPAPVATGPPPLSSADLKRLKRWEKHEGQRKIREEKRLKTMQELTANAKAIFLDQIQHMTDAMEMQKAHEEVSVGLYGAIKKHLGYHDTQLMLAEQIVRDTSHRIFFAVVRVGKLYLDFLHDCVADAPKWGLVVGETVASNEVVLGYEVEWDRDGFTVTEQ